MTRGSGCYAVGEDLDQSVHPGSLVGVFNVRIMDFLSVCLSWTLHRLHWVLTGLTPGWACAPLFGTCCDSVHILYV